MTLPYIGDGHDAVQARTFKLRSTELVDGANNDAETVRRWILSDVATDLHRSCSNTSHFRGVPPQGGRDVKSSRRARRYTDDHGHDARAQLNRRTLPWPSSVMARIYDAGRRGRHPVQCGASIGAPFTAQSGFYDVRRIRNRGTTSMYTNIVSGARRRTEARRVLIRSTSVFQEP